MMQGYQRKHVTPYMHIMVFDVPATSSSFLDRVSKHLISIFALFLRQMVWRRTEQYYDSKQHYFSSNKHNAAGEIILCEARLEMLQNGIRGFPSCE